MIAPTMSNVFRKAAEVQRANGHCKGELQAPDGRVCAMGALRLALASFGLDWASDAGFAARCDLTKALGAMTGEPFSSTDALQFGVSDWNDEEARELAEVEKLFLFAADRAEFPDGGR